MLSEFIEYCCNGSSHDKNHIWLKTNIRMLRTMDVYNGYIHACCNGHIDIVKFIVENCTSMFCFDQDDDGIAHELKGIQCAILTGNYGVVLYLLDYKPNKHLHDYVFDSACDNNCIILIDSLHRMNCKIDHTFNYARGLRVACEKNYEQLLKLMLFHDH